MSSVKRRHGTSLPALTPAARSAAADSIGIHDLKVRAAADEDSVVERHRYAKLLLQYVQRYQKFTSVNLFVETMMRDIALQDGVTLQTQAVIASWAMKLLCNGSPGARVMTVLVDAVFPAIYRDYDEQTLECAPAAIRAFLSDRALIRDNPYFSHATYMEELALSTRRIDALSEELQRTLAANAVWKRFALDLIESAQVEWKKKAFLAWRRLAKRSRVDAKLRRNVVLRQNRKLRSSCLGEAFFRWRFAVEASRTDYLTERLHQAAFQLETSKNQFQMQCLRTERLQLDHEQAQLDAQTIAQERDALQREVMRLNESLIKEEEDHLQRMASNMKGVVALVLKQQSALKQAINARHFPKGLAVGWLEEALEDGNEDADAQAEAGYAVMQNVGSVTVSDYPEGHVLLLKWCNHILSMEEATKKPRHVSNFASDFGDGVVYYHVLRYVFPEKARKKALPSTISVAERLRRVCEMAENSPLAIVLEPDDFKHQREDKILLSLAELFFHQVEVERTAHANKLQESLLPSPVFHNIAGGGGNSNDDDAAAAAAASFVGDDAKTNDECVDGIFKSDEIVMQKVWEWNEDLERWMEELHSNVLHDGRLQNCCAAITREAAHIARERSKGRPIHFVTLKNGLQFVSLSSRNMDDLRVQFKSPSGQMWKATIRTDLSNVLWKHVQRIASIFYHYAGTDARVMYEVQFWRFAEESGLMEEPLIPPVVAQIFDVVISPHLASMFRVSAKDAKNGMSEMMEEIDIRVVKPAQFTEMLVRMAVMRHPGGLIDSTDRFLSTMPPPITTNALPMTKLFYEPASQQVVMHFQQDMARVYFFYMKQQLQDSMKGQSHVPQGCGRFAAHLYHKTYLRIFSLCDFVLHESDDMKSGGSGFSRKTRFMSTSEVQGMLEVLHRRIPSLPADEICFSLFMESFGVACTYWWPDPTVYFTRKLAAFFSVMLRKLRAAHIRDTLVLPEQPHIPLQGEEHVEFNP